VDEPKRLSATITYDETADMLVIRFDDRDGYVHYLNDHVGTIHDEQTDAVVGIQIDAWSILKAEMVADAKEMRAYVPSPEPIVITKRLTVDRTYYRPPSIVLDDDTD
jgi:hypothetical protein